MRQLDLFGTVSEVKQEEIKQPEKEVVQHKIEENDVEQLQETSIIEAVEQGKLEEADIVEESQLITDAISQDSLVIEEVSSVELHDSKEDTNVDILIEEPVSEIDLGETVLTISQTGDESQNSPETIITPSKIEEPSLPQPEGPENTRNGSVIFNDGKITVKIKAKVPVAPVAEKEPEKIKKLIQKRGRKSFKEIDAEADLIEIPDDEVLYEKQYYSISQVAQWFKVNTSLIRFWENEFDIVKPKKNRKGDRLFRPEDVKNLQLIYHLLRDRKYTIEGAKEYLKTNKKKADVQLQLTNTLQKFKSFLLDLKANLS